MQVIAEGLQNPEGPLSFADGSWVVTEMDVGAITQILPSGEHRHIATTGLPNGLAYGRGRIWVADAVDRALLAVDLDGNVEEITNGSDSERFLLPNDLCFGSDGMLYMTDSGILLSEMRKVPQIEAYDLQFDGRLYRINPSTGQTTILDRGFRLTNGIAFGPGGDYLFVAETLSGEIYRYKIDTWLRESFGNVMIKKPQEFGRIAGPDGIAFDNNGNLFVTVIAQGDITVLNPEGEQVGHIEMPGDIPTNVAFDVNGTNQMGVTEAQHGKLFLVSNDYPGLPLFS